MTRLEKLFELGVGYRSLIEIKRMDVNDVVVRASWHIFPWILHIYTGIIAAFDLNSAYPKFEISFRNANHAGRRRVCRLSWRNLYHLLPNRFPRARVARERTAGAFGHESKQIECIRRQ